jgi:thioredoxin:protein disulfide reductase
MRVRAGKFECMALAAFAILGAMGSTARATAQDSTSMPAAATIVKPHVFVSLEPVPREKEFEAAIVVDIQRGYHMNSHKPNDPYSIPTTVTPALPAGIELRDTAYPNGRLEKFSFSSKEMDVYSGSVTLKLKLTARADAALGEMTIPVTLRYQACNDTACLPPVKVPVKVKFEVTAAGTAARAAHPEIFSASSPKN